MRPGETVAIVGRTGCGKSTLARLLPRFYDVRGGQVLIDGVDVRDYQVKSLRAHIGLVLDEPFLFSESIRDNITYGRPDASLDEVIAAARAAGAHEFIEELEDGYDTRVGERGYTLSGGQRQRVAIARALLLNPKFLILDDATSSIDVGLELEIHDALSRLMRGRTTLIIAHRLRVDHHRAMICDFAAVRRLVHRVDQHLSRRVTVGVGKNGNFAIDEMCHHRIHQLTRMGRITAIVITLPFRRNFVGFTQIGRFPLRRAIQNHFHASELQTIAVPSVTYGIHGFIIHATNNRIDDHVQREGSFCVHALEQLDGGNK